MVEERSNLVDEAPRLKHSDDFFPPAPLVEDGDSSVSHDVHVLVGEIELAYEGCFGIKKVNLDRFEQVVLQILVFSEVEILRNDVLELRADDLVLHAGWHGGQKVPEYALIE